MATLINGTRVIVAIPEYANPPTMFLLDATDYSRIKLLSEWTLYPDRDLSGEQAALFSLHNFQIVGHRVYLAMYHGGVWVFDIADPTMPKPVAYTLPRPAEARTGTLPLTWDVVVANGYVIALDIPTGLHFFHFVDDPAGDARFDSFA
jgi:hypothetical protein